MKNPLLKEKKAFSQKRDLNMPFITKAVLILLIVFVIVVLFLPDKKEAEKPFRTEVERQPLEATPDPVSYLPTPVVETRTFVKTNDLPSTSAPLDGTQKNRNVSMLVMRGGLDTKNQLSPGTRFRVSTTEKVLVSGQSMPIVSSVLVDVIQESSVAIPKESKVLGDITFDEATERAVLNLKSIITPDGRERPLSGVAVDLDGHVGVQGKVHSSSGKNVIGQTLSTFVGAYAQGSMSKGSFGAQEGGADNGLKYAVGEVATDRADRFGQELQKETVFLEISAGKNLYVVLNQPFTFRDPGGIYGQ